jgi:putative nucleotidyltransferase with HDIG domain/PAS domain S-box-containing protein
MSDTVRKTAVFKVRPEMDYYNKLDSFLEGCQVIGFDWRYLYLNNAAVKHARKTREELLGRTMMEAYPGIENTLLYKKLKKSMEKRIPSMIENEFTYPDGAGSWFELRVEPVPEGIFVLSIDITKRKNAEEFMRFTNVLLSTQLESSIDGILVVSDEGKVLSYNKKFLDIWSIRAHKAENVIVSTVINMMADKADDSKKFLEKMEYLCADKDEKSRYEVELIDSRILDMYSSPMLGPDEKYYGRVWYFRDITDRKVYEDELKKSYLSLKKNLGDMIDTIAKIGEMRDQYTAGHQKRVAYLAVEIARKLGLDREQLEEINMSAMVHDIGKIHIPSSILTRPGKLTDLEFSLIRTHPEGGYNIIQNIDFPASVAKTILQHHERMDGSGYPKGLGEKDICLGARIIAVADVVEAMASHRPYRPALGIDLAAQEIKEGRGIKYDADVADACIAIISSSGFKFVAEEKDDQSF